MGQTEQPESSNSNYMTHLKILAFCLGFTIVYLIGLNAKRKNTETEEDLRTEWNNAGRNVVVLHHHPRSPYAINLEALFRSHGVNYQSDTQVPLSNTKKSPWITLNGIDIANTQQIIPHVSVVCNVNFNAGLTPVEIGIVGSHDLHTYLRRKGDLREHKRGLRLLNTFANTLDDKDYVFGTAQPQELDCLVFGLIAFYVDKSKEGNAYFSEILDQQPNVVEHFRRLGDRVFDLQLQYL